MGPLELPDQTTSLKEQPMWRPGTQTAADSLDPSHSLCDPGLLPNLSVPRFPSLCLWPVTVLTSLGCYERLMS